MLASLSSAQPPAAAPSRHPDGYPESRPERDLAGLRARVRAIERGAAYGGLRRRVAPLGAAGGGLALDAHLPGGGLPLGGLHEIEGGRAEWDDGAATGFCVGLLARLLDAGPEPGSGCGGGKPVLWVSPWRDLYAPGLLAFGLDPGRLIQVRAGAGAAGTEVLWAMEEGLRCARLAAVVGEVDALERGPGRRLQLAAEASGVTAFALRRGLRPAQPARAGASAAVTRWRVEAEAGEAGQSLERPRWRVELLRCRGAAPGQWCLEWDNAAGGFAMAAALRDRPPALGAGRPGGGADRPRLAV
jgi:protein ImuA